MGGPVYWNATQVNGAIPICHLGCCLRQWLVVTGPEAGNVWDDVRADYAGFKPVQSKGERVKLPTVVSIMVDEMLRQLLRW